MVNIDEEFKESKISFNVETLKDSKFEMKQLTISDVELREFKKEESIEKKLILSFKETDMGLTLNITNMETLKDSFGSETDDWIGKKIRLVIDPNVRFQGKKQGGIRIKV